jgi:hypothetical protein
MKDLIEKAEIPLIKKIPNQKAWAILIDDKIAYVGNSRVDCFLLDLCPRLHRLSCQSIRNELMFEKSKLKTEIATLRERERDLEFQLENNRDERIALRQELEALQQKLDAIEGALNAIESHENPPGGCCGER